MGIDLPSTGTAITPSKRVGVALAGAVVGNTLTPTRTQVTPLPYPTLPYILTRASYQHSPALTPPSHPNPSSQSSLTNPPSPQPYLTTFFPHLNPLSGQRRSGSPCSHPRSHPNPPSQHTLTPTLSHSTHNPALTLTLLQGNDDQVALVPGLCEALGMSEFASVMDAVKEVLPWAKGTTPTTHTQHNTTRTHTKHTRLINQSLLLLIVHPISTSFLCCRCVECAYDTSSNISSSPTLSQPTL